MRVVFCWLLWVWVVKALLAIYLIMLVLQFFTQFGPGIPVFVCFAVGLGCGWLLYSCYVFCCGSA